jgi:extracellular elastinolytic metalloproteinase
MARNEQPRLANFHALYDVGARSARGLPPRSSRAVTGPARLSAAVPDLEVEYDEATGNPCRVTRRVAGAALSARRAAEPARGVLDFVKERSDVWGLDASDLESIQVVSTSVRGLPTVRLIQRLDGVDVFNSEVSASLTPNNEVVGIVGQFFHGTGRADTRLRARSTRRAGPEEAIARAVAEVTGKDAPAVVPAPGAEADPAGPYRYYEWKKPTSAGDPRLERPIRAKDVLFPIGDGSFVPAYFFELFLVGFPAYAYVVDAVDTPDILYRKCLTSHVAFRYGVHNTGDALRRPCDGPAPGSPHPTGFPNGFQAPTIAETTIEIESLLPGRPWLPSNATQTEGNNCKAFANLKGGNLFQPGDVMGRISAPGEFLYSYDHSKDARDPTNLQNSLVGMFFHVNYLHDRWYEAGFDEASGNAQQDNFGLGGLGGDPIIAQGNDMSGTDNANMATPADGASPIMRMYEFMGPTPAKPSRTSNHEALITFHEMGHYITNRLVGNTSGLSNQQGEAMGEGWGDFFAASMTSQATDDFSKGVFAVGGWTDLTPTFKENYYFSIRRYPYSADMTKNPLTFRHISDSASLPSGIPRGGGSGPNNSEVHNAGEVWCSALWEVFVNLVAKHGHVEAEKRMLVYVIGGLKQTPLAPTFTQARDGIISTVRTLDASDLRDVWAGFAKRGMGVGAVSPPSTSMSLAGVVESFTVPP